MKVVTRRKGRPISTIYSDLNYELRKNGRKYSAFCLYCRKVLQNVAAQRLRVHRYICRKEVINDVKVDKFVHHEQILTEEIVIKPEIDDTIDIESSESEAMIPSQTPQQNSFRKEPENSLPGAFVLLHSERHSTNTKEEESPTTSYSPEENLGRINENKETLATSPDSILVTQQEPSNLPSSSKTDEIEIANTIRKSDRLKSQNMYRAVRRRPSKLNKTGKHKTKRIDIKQENILVEDKERIDESLAKFLYGCNIPLSVIESQHFINFIHQIRPDYVYQIPVVEELATSLLETEYQKQIENRKRCIENESVLLLDSRKTRNNDGLDIIGVLQNSQGEHIFLDVWNVPVNFEIENYLPSITEKFLLRAREVYSTTIYVVVSQYASSLISLENKNVWHSICHIHVANLLAKDLTNKNLVDGVKLIINLLHQSEFEKDFIRKGGSKITNFENENYFSYRNLFLWFLRNLFYIRDVAIEPKCKIFHDQVKGFIFSSTFIEDIKKSIDLLDPIYDIIDKAQSATFSIADAANLWLSLKPPTEYKHFNDLYNKRKAMALNIYAISGYYLNPFYSNDKLTANQLKTIEDFLHEYLDAGGLVEWGLYKDYQGFFNILIAKNVDSANIFWKTAHKKHPKISKLALNLLNIPASVESTQAKSSWSYTYSNTISDLTFEQSKKLIHIYHSLNLNDNKNEDF